MSVPAAARMDASGVRRSWETESSNADLIASLRREISAVVASRRSRSRSSDPPIWSAAAAITRVSPASGSPSSRGRIDPDGAERSIARGDGDPIGGLVAGLRRLLRRSGGVHPDPLGRLIAGASTERGVHRRVPWRRAAGRVRCRPRSPRPPSSRRGSASTSSHTIRAIAARRRRRIPFGREREGDVEQRAGLALAFGRRDGTVALAAGQDDRRRRPRRAAG